jgi:hypothetical protein
MDDLWEKDVDLSIKVDLCAILGCCVGIRGNIEYNAGDNTDISDLVYLVDYMFSNGSPPFCWEEANVDGSGDGSPDGSEDIDISDLVYVVDYMFTGGPPPVDCQ